MRKKLISLMLSFVLAFSLVPTAYAARIQLGQTGKTKQITKIGNQKMDAHKIQGGSTVGMYFAVPGEQLQAVSIVSPSFADAIGSLTLTLYQWKGSYKSTIATKPIMQRTFSDYSDGTSLKIILPIEKVYTGEFLLTAGNSVQDVGVWKSNANSEITSEVSSKCFIDGSEIPQYFISSCVTAPIQERDNTKEIKTKDAYSKIFVTENDEYVGGWFSERQDESVGETVPYFGGLSTSSYLYFGKVDFGKTPAKGFRMRAYNQGAYGNITETQVVLDSLIGYPIGKTTMMLEVPQREWETTTCVLTEEVTGVHDVYLIFRGSEIAPSWFQFTTEIPEKSRTDLRLENYLNTPAIAPIERYEDTWAASDMIGRKLPDNKDVGDPRENKQTAIFYHNWRSLYSRTMAPLYDVTKIQNSYAGDHKEIKNDPNYPYWGSGAHFWNESVYGYYIGYDEWVMRKQLELFAAADIDAIFFDNSNQNIVFAQGFMSMAKLIHEMKTQGIDAPGISFITPFGANSNTVDDIRLYYDNMYSIGLYQDAWFYWDGKPVLMSFPDLLKNETGYDDIDKQNKEMLEFFTVRPAQGNYWAGQTISNMWSWAEVYPQHGFVKERDGSYEMVSVSVAQNTNDTDARGTYSAMNGEGIFGRSYTYANKHALLDEKSSYMGYNFQEQWDRALEIDPQLIFITGWNEGIANRYTTSHAGVVNAFVDEYDNEHSRDIEPLKSDFKDTYYYLMVKNIRKYKGVQKTPEAGNKVTIDVSGSFSQWDNVALTYYDYVGLPDRDSLKMGQLEKYQNFTGRNDFKTAKAARDNDNLYFYVETADDITPYTDNAWMRLFLNTDRIYSTGWEGYDYALNIEPASKDTLVLSRSTGFWQWEKVADVPYKLEGNKMMVQIPRELVYLNGISNIDMEFKWADNMQTYGNLMEDFYTNGDVAPIARYNYRFVENASRTSTKAIEEFIYPEPNVFDKVRNFTTLKIDTPYALTDDGIVPIDSTNDAVTPIVLNDRTFVPIRFVTEKLGATAIKWDDATSTATITYFQKTIEITEGSNAIVVDGKRMRMDVAAFTKNDRMYVPLRAVSEAFGNVWIYWEDPCYVFVGNKYTETYKDDPEVRWLMNKYF